MNFHFEASGVLKIEEENSKEIKLFEYFLINYLKKNSFEEQWNSS
jgi:hypothetical protein